MMAVVRPVLMSVLMLLLLLMLILLLLLMLLLLVRFVVSGSVFKLEQQMVARSPTNLQSQVSILIHYKVKSLKKHMGTRII